MKVKSLLLALGLSLVVGKSFAISFKVDGINYVANADTAIIKGYSDIPENGELKLASTVTYGGKDYRVTTVQGSAFLSCTDIKKLIVPASVKYIQSGAFENCVNMSNLVLEQGDDVLDAASDAFKNCEIEEATIGRNLERCIFKMAFSLQKVRLNKNVSVLPDEQFYSCSSLCELNLDAVKIVGKRALNGCLKLSNIDLGTVEKIGEGAFAGVNINHLVLGEKLNFLGNDAFSSCISLTSVVWNCVISKIPISCFSGCKSLITFKHNANLKEIESEAFWGCNSLDSFDWNNIEIIGKKAFSGCSFKDLDLPSSIKSLGEDAFKDCYDLKNVDLSATMLKEIECFRSCYNLENIMLPEKLETIGYNCFRDCGKLTGLMLPKSLKELGNYSFYGAKNIQCVDLSNTHVHIIPYNAFANCDLLQKVILNESTDTIASCAFKNCVNLSMLKNIDNIEFAGSQALDNTKFLVDATIGPLILGKVLYRYIGSIEDKNYIVPANITRLCEKALAGQKFQTVQLNDALKFIDEGVFDDCDNLVSLEIPKSVLQIRESKGCSKLSLLKIVDSNTPLALSELKGSMIKKLYLGRFISTECDWMPALESLTIGKFVDSFLGQNFKSSNKIIDLELMDTDKHLNIGQLPIEKIRKLYMGRNLVGILGFSCNSFKTLSDLSIGLQVDSICDNFAYANESLDEIVIDGNVKYVGKNAFGSATNLKKVFVGSNVRIVNEGAFTGLTNIQKLVLHDGLEKVGDGAFHFYTQNILDSVYIPKTIKEMGRSAFGELRCKRLVLPEGLEMIGFNSFSNLKTDSLILPSTIKSMQESFIFGEIKYVDASKIKCNLNSSFYENRKLENILLPKEGLTKLTENEFWYCASLKNIELPNTINTIDHDAFSATKITVVRLPKSVEKVESGILRQMYDVKPDKLPSVIVEGDTNSKAIRFNNSFYCYMNKIDVQKECVYSFDGESQTNRIDIDTLVLRDIKKFEIQTEYGSRFLPAIAICLSPHLTSCDLWKPTSGKIFVLPGSQLPKDDVTYMYTVNKVEYVPDADGNVLFDGVNNMPYGITPVFYQDDKEVELKEAGVYDLSMKIAGTSFDGIYPTGLKITVKSATGINRVVLDSDSQHCPIYNMNGQRVDESYKGVVIQNGKKRIAK